MLDRLPRLVGIMLASLKDRRALLMENLFLRQRLAVALRARLFWVMAHRLVPEWRRHLVLVRPETHGRRELIRAAVTAHPTAAWVWRQLIEATPWGRQPQSLVRDRDRVYGSNFVSRAEAMGTQTLLTPFRAPKANAIAERVVRTLRNDCLDHVLILNEPHLRAVLAEYVANYNVERPHRSLVLQPPLPAPRSPQSCTDRRDQVAAGAWRTAPLETDRVWRPVRTGSVAGPIRLDGPTPAWSWRTE